MVDFIDALNLMKQGYVMQMQYGGWDLFKMQDKMLWTKRKDQEWQINSDLSFYVLMSYKYTIYEQ